MLILLSALLYGTGSDRFPADNTMTSDLNNKHFILFDSSLVVIPNQCLLLPLDAITKPKNRMQIIGTPRESDNISVF